MEWKVDIDLIEMWLAKNGGVVELAYRSGVGVETIRKLKNRINPAVPKKKITRRLISDAVGVDHDRLFKTAQTEAS